MISVDVSPLVQHPAYELVRELHYTLCNKFGFPTVIVGGAVRSLIMREKRLNDIDLATAATPDKILEIFKEDYIVVPVGIEFGSLRICLRENPKIGVDITTYRQDIDCTGRHAKVVFSNTIIDDVQRRDFTINGLALALPSFGIIDIVGGVNDIRNNLIRTIGDPDKRFEEDYLRMLRACRFMALNDKMTIETTTLEAIKRHAHKIHVSLENKATTDRQRQEILKGMGYRFPSRMIEAMRLTGLLHYILPEVEATVGITQNKYHNLYQMNENIMQYVENELVKWPITNQNRRSNHESK